MRDGRGSRTGMEGQGWSWRGSGKALTAGWNGT